MLKGKQHVSHAEESTSHDSVLICVYIYPVFCFQQFKSSIKRKS